MTASQSNPHEKDVQVKDEVVLMMHKLHARGSAWIPSIAAEQTRSPVCYSLTSRDEPFLPPDLPLTLKSSPYPPPQPPQPPWCPSAKSREEGRGKG